MSNKIPERCWYCRSRDLEVMPYGARCKSCGATWTPIVKLGPAVLKFQEEEDARKAHADPYQGNSPAPALVAKLRRQKAHSSAQGVSK